MNFKVLTDYWQAGSINNSNLVWKVTISANYLWPLFCNSIGLLIEENAIRKNALSCRSSQSHKCLRQHSFSRTFEKLHDHLSNELRTAEGRSNSVQYRENRKTVATSWNTIIASETNAFRRSHTACQVQFCQLKVIQLVWWYRLYKLSMSIHMHTHITNELLQVPCCRFRKLQKDTDNHNHNRLFSYYFRKCPDWITREIWWN